MEVAEVANIFVKTGKLKHCKNRTDMLNFKNIWILAPYTINAWNALGNNIHCRVIVLLIKRNMWRSKL